MLGNPQASPNPVFWKQGSRGIPAGEHRLLKTVFGDPLAGRAGRAKAAEGRRGGPSQACPRVELFYLKCYPVLSCSGHVTPEK